MGSCLRCIAGPHEGRELPLDPGKALELPVKTRGEAGGVLRVHREGGLWVFVNSSDIVCFINGAEARRAVINDGDHLKVGKLTFAVALVPTEVTPVAVAVLGVDSSQAEKGDTVVVRVPPPGAAAVRAATSVSGRSRRRISASRPAVQSAAQPRRPSLFSRVSQVFRRGGRQEGFRELLNLRERLLRGMGRVALERQGGLGLPESFLRRLSSGERIAVAKEDLGSGDLEIYRRCRQRLAQLDAEIEALRHELDLGPDGVDEGLMEVLAQLDGSEERAHSSLDQCHTDRLPADTDEEPAAVADRGTSSSSGSRRRRAQ